VRRLFDAFQEPFRKVPKSAAAAAGAARGGESQQQQPTQQQQQQARGSSQLGAGGSGSQGGAARLSLQLGPAPEEITEIIGGADEELAGAADDEEIYDPGDFEEE
jgi:hypothetical protein